MNLELWNAPGGGLVEVQRETTELLASNEVLRRYGLELSPRQAQELAVHHQKSLQETGRIAFGGGITAKIAVAFSDSPYVDVRTLPETLARLTEIFYHFKNETEERLTDEELIGFMEKRFNGVCQGSLDLLQGRELEALARLAHGLDLDEEEPAPTGLEDEEDADE